ncbi:hypothetical protein C8T65DRAFT_19344 [Cerioporus squamosus]|nr:hypothetical protein C8T65DRAFT_19344 [Cerioporus squamosus]
MGGGWLEVGGAKRVGQRELRWLWAPSIECFVSDDLQIQVSSRTGSFTETRRNSDTKYKIQRYKWTNTNNLTHRASPWQARTRKTSTTRIGHRPQAASTRVVTAFWRILADVRTGTLEGAVSFASTFSRLIGSSFATPFGVLTQVTPSKGAGVPTAVAAGDKAAVLGSTSRPGTDAGDELGPRGGMRMRPEEGGVGCEAASCGASSTTCWGEAVAALFLGARLFPADVDFLEVLFVVALLVFFGPATAFACAGVSSTISTSTTMSTSPLVLASASAGPVSATAASAFAGSAGGTMAASAFWRSRADLR